MKLLCKLSLLIILLMTPELLTAQRWIKTYSTDPYIGPEIYYMRRLREGGVKQTGTLYGFRAGYDHVRRKQIYWGIDGLWATGTLDGCAGENRLKSDFTDSNVEARLGYTFQSRCWRCLSFTPYAGLGYFWEQNNYKHPSPLHVHFTNHFSYVPVGFLSQVFILPNLSIGVNFKVRVIIEGEQHTRKDPAFGHTTQHYDEKLQYRVELPIDYFYTWKCHSLGICLAPFYEYRHYGNRANFPFNYFDTKLELYGATLKFQYLF